MTAVGNFGTLNKNLSAVLSIQSVQPLSYLFLIFTLFYAAQLVAFEISTDSEFAAVRSGADGWTQPGHDYWLREGRWGIYLIERFLMPQPVVPFLPLASFGGFMALAYLMLLRACGMEELGFRHYATFPVFAAFPIWYFIAQFPANMPATGVGMALSGVFLLAFHAAIDARQRETPSRKRALAGLYLVQVVSAALAISIYQSFAPLLLAGGVGVLLVSALRSRSASAGTVLDMAGLGLAVVAGVALYAAVLQLFLLLTDPQIDEGTSRIITDFVNPGILLTAPYQVARRTAAEIVAVYGGFDGLYGLTAWSFGLLPLVALGALGLSPQLRMHPALRLVLLAQLVAILLLPFVINPINRGAMPYRSLISVPLALWFCAFVCLEFGGRFVRRVASVAVALVLAQSLYVFALFQASNAIARQYDKRLAEAIHARIVEVRRDSGRTGLSKVEFFGAAPLPNAVYPVSRTETVGRSIFHWGHPNRPSPFLRALGYADIQDVSAQERAELVREFMAMGVWPDSTSVRIVGDVTLVRLSETPGVAHRRLLEADRK